MSWRRAHGDGSNLLQCLLVIRSMKHPIKNILDTSPAVDCRLLQNICGKPDSFVGPFSRDFFLASARCRQLDMKATDPKLHVCKATAPCTESVFHLCYTSGAAETVRAKKKVWWHGAVGAGMQGSVCPCAAGAPNFSCKLHEPNGFSQKDVTVYKFGAVRCISAACNFACSTCFSHQAESVKIDSPRQCTWKVCRIRFHQFFRYLECSFLTWRGNQDTYHKGKHHTGSTISPLQISEFLQYHFIKHQWLLKPHNPR